MVQAERRYGAAPASSRRALRVGFYDIERTLGKGNFAVVKLARHRVTRNRVAIKIIDKSRLEQQELERVHREVQIMKLLNHPHIIKLYQNEAISQPVGPDFDAPVSTSCHLVMESQDMLYIVTEFAQNGEMFDYLSACGPLSEQEARDKFCQILSAVEYCHRLHIVHRDLKSENLLLDTNMNVKIADFGFGTFYKSGELLSTWCGSPPYAAPEVFEGKSYEGPHLDVWSLGVVLYVLVCGSLPFDGPTLPVLRQRVIEGRFRIPFFLSADCESLIRRMLVVDPVKRITIPQIKQHCWILGQEILHKPLTLSLQDYSSNLGNYNQQALHLMNTLGIDREKTIESLQNSSYNHFAAIYYLLLERMKEFRKSQMSPAQSHRSSSSDSQNTVDVELMTSGLKVVRSSFPVPYPDTECELLCALQPVLAPVAWTLTRNRCASPAGTMMGDAVGGESRHDPDKDVRGNTLNSPQPLSGGCRRHTVAEVSTQLSHTTAPDAPGVPDATCSDSCLTSSSIQCRSSIGQTGPSSLFHSWAPPMEQSLGYRTHCPSLAAFQKGRRASDTTLTAGPRPLRRLLCRGARVRGIPGLYRATRPRTPLSSLVLWDQPALILHSVIQPGVGAALSSITTADPCKNRTQPEQPLHHRELQQKLLGAQPTSNCLRTPGTDPSHLSCCLAATLLLSCPTSPSISPLPSCPSISPSPLLSCPSTSPSISPLPSVFHFFQQPVCPLSQPGQRLHLDTEMIDLSTAQLGKPVLVN
ncbi:serine/threonine-protein kinase SIK1 isoform X2 [Narcine bancroftii]|uniref:serine/threonine-protein kinase SIK1 isoform X2 n=1 Tax=Narcine bancroftii TaxID=1343680 RepID=UPI0038310BF6